MTDRIAAIVADSLEVKQRFFVENDDTQRIQETPNLIGHIICELIESELFSE